MTMTPGGSQTQAGPIRILVVCTWPLGGIRTFLKYNYRRFPKDRFQVTVLANPTHERESVERDLQDENISVIWTKSSGERHFMFRRIAALLREKQIDCIHSQGFTSAFHTAIANRRPRRPHVLTMHGIVEPKYFAGWAGPFKRLLFRRVLSRVTVFHAVGQDMLDHFRSQLPRLAESSARQVVISHGIDTERFLNDEPGARVNLHQLLECDENTVVFGYFGRFMPEKGFDLLVRAIEVVVRQTGSSGKIRVLAMGTGDYEKASKRMVVEHGLGEVVRFHPFTPEVDRFIKGCNAVVIPSRHEAYGLLACEALVAGVPVIASDAMGLREAVRNTPALSFPVNDVEKLADIMTSVMNDTGIRSRFESFRPKAARRFDVRRSAAELVALFEELAGSARPT